VTVTTTKTTTTTYTDTDTYYTTYCSTLDYTTLDYTTLDYTTLYCSGESPDVVADTEVGLVSRRGPRSRLGEAALRRLATAAPTATLR